MIVMAIDGVLRDPGTREVIPQGRLMYRVFSEGLAIALLSDDVDEESDTDWLKTHGMFEHNFLAALGGEPIKSGRRNQFSRIRTRGSIDFVVESDPYAAAASISCGITVMLMATPAYISSDFMPESTRIPVSWADLINETTRQRETKANDIRLKQEII